MHVVKESTGKGQCRCYMRFLLCCVLVRRAVHYCCLLRAGWCCCGSIQTLDRFLHLVPALGIVNYLVDDVLV
jgi:hypothetical protein